MTFYKFDFDSPHYQTLDQPLRVDYNTRLEAVPTR